MLYIHRNGKCGEKQSYHGEMYHKKVQLYQMGAENTSEKAMRFAIEYELYLFQAEFLLDVLNFGARQWNG